MSALNVQRKRFVLPLHLYIHPTFSFPGKNYRGIREKIVSNKTSPRSSIIVNSSLAESNMMQHNLQDAPPIANKDSSVPHRHVKFILRKPMEIQDKELPQQQPSYGNSPPFTNIAPSNSMKCTKKCRKRALQYPKVDGESVANTSNQLVLYDPKSSNICQDITTVPDHNDSYALALRRTLVSNSASRVLPTVGAFTVQCANCFKWRLVPTKERYQQIRERVLENPFICKRARAWRPDIRCEDPTDIVQDGSKLWAIDKPNIPKPPSGWERELRIRGEGASQFADIYYTSPSGKRMRSTVEIQRYLEKHPEYAEQGVSISQFSFQTPKPLQENYLRRRSSKVSNPADGGSGLPTPLQTEVNPLQWWVEPTGEEIQRVHAFETAPFDPSLPSRRKKKKNTGYSDIYSTDISKINDNINPIYHQLL